VRVIPWWWPGIVGCSGATPILPVTLPPPSAATSGTTGDTATADGEPARCRDGVAEVGELCFGDLVVHPAPGPARRIDAGELDGDGRPDVVTVDDGPDGQLAAFTGDGRGGLALASSVALPARDVRFLQADRDGRDDLFVAGIPFLGNAVVFGDGDAVLPEAPDTHYYWNTIARAVPVDWDADGTTDIAVAVPTKGDGIRVGFDLSRPGETISDGGFLPVASSDACRAIDLVVDDFAGTGVAHAAVACEESRVSVYRYDPSAGPYEAGVQVGLSVAVEGAPVAIERCDLDGNGVQDLVVASSGSVTVLQGDGAGRFSRVGTWSAGTAPVDLACVDLDRDGSPDVVTLEDGAAGGEVLRVRRGNGDRTLQGFTTAFGLGAIERDPAAFVLTDLDDDGALDFALALGAAEAGVGTLLATP